MRQKFGNIYLFFAILFLIFFMPFSFFLKWAHSPNYMISKEVVYYVEEGKSAHEIAYALQKHHVIAHPELFKWYIKLTHREKKIKFGTFIFKEYDTPAGVLDRLVKGDSIKLKVTIPEGLNIYQISNKLSQLFPDHKEEDWLKLMFDKDMIALLPVVKYQPKSVEGFLYPDTYFFDPHEKPENVIKSLVSHFKQVITDDMMRRAHELGLAPLQFITLASIVQKESSIVAELNQIAAVFYNRLKINMKLQSDPTVIYGIWGTYQGRLSKKHLRSKNQYNTYTKYGLPVGPIANPGFSSLMAVLYPAQSNSLYFVAAGDGSHVFSSTYADHQKAVRKYIQYLRSHAR